MDGNTTNRYPFPIRSWEIFWYGSIAVLGTVGNGVVMMVMILNKNIKMTSFNFTIFSLAFTDFLASFIGLPNYILSTSIFNHPDGLKGDWLCKLFTGYFWPFFFLDVSVFILVYIAIERRKAILDPIGCQQNRINNYSFFIILLIVIFASILGIPTVYGMVYNIEKNIVGNCCTYKYSYLQSICIYFAVFILDTIIPAVAMIVCYRQISSSLGKSNVLLKASIHLNNQRKNLNKTTLVFGSKFKTVQTMKIVILAFFACIVPNHLLYLLSLISVRGLEWNSVVSQIGVLIRFSNTCVNPFIYSIKSKQFKKNFWFVYDTRIKGRSNYKILNRTL
ncbi:chemerin-like receptor 2 isoform X1 [Hydra vulgaris]|uniref:chemerin-like receptor 2 isoform X1 n=1 Tax=Hydra vulgaris TaxID=6087 RepID=UPI000640E695